MSDKSVPFGKWLYDQLEQRGWTPADFAARANVPPSNLSRWLNGRRLPDSASSERIANALGKHPDEVLERAGHRPGGLDDQRRREAIASRRYYEARRELGEIQKRIDKLVREMDEDAPYSVNGKG